VVTRRSAGGQCAPAALIRRWAATQLLRWASLVYRQYSGTLSPVTTFKGSNCWRLLLADDTDWRFGPSGARPAGLGNSSQFDRVLYRRSGSLLWSVSGGKPPRLSFGSSLQPLGCAVSILRFFGIESFHVNLLVFLGCYCLAIGYLILRSAFLPRVLGVLMAVGGLGWLTFISPALSACLSPYNMLPGILGESALTVWLLAAGVNIERWKEQAGAAA